MVALLAAPLCWADAGGFDIAELYFYGSVSEENVVSAVETIDVNFTEYRHGIYRTIPEFFHLSDYDSKDRLVTKEYVTQVKNICVDGAPSSYSSEDDNTVIKIGDANSTVIGPMSYKISYDYCIPDDRIGDYDLFYYSVLGSEWDAPVEHFIFRVDFEKDIPTGTEFSIYSGVYGNRDNSLDVEAYIDGNTVYGEAYNVPAGGAVTLYAQLPEGYFKPGKKVSPIFAWVLFVLSIVAALFALFKMIFTSQQKPVQTVEFYAPSGVAPAEVGMIIDNSADVEDLVSLIPWWASKGLLKIENKKEEKLFKKDHIILTKLQDLDESAPDYQKKFFDALFSDGDVLDMADTPKDFGDDVEKARKELGEYFKDERKLYENDWVGTIYTVVSAAFLGLSIMLNSPVAYFHDGFMAVFPFGAAVLSSVFMASAAEKRNFKKKAFIRNAIICILLNLFACMIFFVAMEGSEGFVDWILFAIPMVLNTLVALFSYRLTSMTQYNYEVTGKLMGLKEFIKTAELPKLRALCDEDPSYFFNVLPFAMVFDLSSKWGDKFKDINISQPSWWYDPYYSTTGFTTAALTRSITSGMEGALNAVSSSVSASTSSSGSGGFSGGGGGGGGGGSW